MVFRKKEWMERLTQEEKRKIDNIEKLVKQLEGNIIDLTEQLKAYKDAEEQGLLLRLPCKVGDIVYLVDKIHEKVKVSVVGHIEYIVNSNAEYPFTKIKGEGFCVFFDDFGKILFLTREEAEAKLAELRGKQE